ncbi:hypothetical protein BHM03_00004410 [Ensete ventricosum]|nr:hypothetical protein BHM03_00004410 [Ensete ventricosum]
MSAMQFFLARATDFIPRGGSVTIKHKDEAYRLCCSSGRVRKESNPDDAREVLCREQRDVVATTVATRKRAQESMVATANGRQSLVTRRVSSVSERSRTTAEEEDETFAQDITDGGDGG